MKLLVFDIRGEYAHYKKIYATTSAVSYCVPPKTSLYGYVGAILGLPKGRNRYLEHFSDKRCLLGIQLLRPVVMERMHINLLKEIGKTEVRKQTLMEFVWQPEYRIFFYHSDAGLLSELETMLREHRAVFTPTLGLASLISDFRFVETLGAERVSGAGRAFRIESVIPQGHFVRFDTEAMLETENEIVEQTMVALEMDTQRRVTERDDLIFDRKGRPIAAFVTHCHHLENGKHVALF